MCSYQIGRVSFDTYGSRQHDYELATICVIYKVKANVPEQRKPRLIFPFLVAVVAILFAIWSYFVFITGNPIWFLATPERIYVPDRIVIHHYGTTTELTPDQDEFWNVNVALNEALGHFRGRVSVGLSPATVEDYRTKEFVVELFFASDIGPVLGLSNTINHLLIPVDGRHSNNHFVFAGENDQWLASAFVMADSQPIFAILDELDYAIR
ncbi:MAG: hypothetical protein D6711_06875 [Chloroflexi bacterium]|nr:MAG: hypothetical protein D6711_06875 [Chloroflexota bacterium]